MNLTVAAANVDATLSPIAAPRLAFEIEIHSDFRGLEADWLRLEHACEASPYQTLHFCRAWSETIGAAHGATPLIALARSPDGQLAALLPLSRRRIGPIRCASFQGGRMANYHMGLFREPERWTRSEIVALLKGVARRARLDLFLFAQQPIAWRGLRNPMTGIGGNPSPSFAYATRPGSDYAGWLAGHYSAEARKKRRAKTRKLQALGPVAHRRAHAPHERRAAFEALIAQKRDRMAALDLINEYDDPAVANFIFQLSELEENAGFEWHVAMAGERIVSVFGGLVRAGRLSGLFFSHDTAPEVASASPGELMVLSLAEQAIARGLETLDFGVGEARYKSEACEIEEPMLDAAFPATLVGFAGAAAFLLTRRIKRRIKQSPRLFEAARSAQRLLFRRRAR